MEIMWFRPGLNLSNFIVFRMSVIMIYLNFCTPTSCILRLLGAISFVWWQGYPSSSRPLYRKRVMALETRQDYNIGAKKGIKFYDWYRLSTTSAIGSHLGATTQWRYGPRFSIVQHASEFDVLTSAIKVHSRIQHWIILENPQWFISSVGSRKLEKRVTWVSQMKWARSSKKQECLRWT